MALFNAILAAGQHRQGAEPPPNKHEQQRQPDPDRHQLSM